MRMHPTERGRACVCRAALSLCMAGCNGVLGIEPAELEPTSTSSPVPQSPAIGAANVDAAGGAAPSTSAAAPEPIGASPAPGLPAEESSTTGMEALGEAPPVAAAPAATPPVPAASSPAADAGTPLPEPVPVAVPAGPPLGADGLAAPLPDDLIGAPVAGEIIYSAEASWEVDGVFRPTFEVHTPTGSYWIVESLGTMVSMQDPAGSQWIDFSSGFRPLRNVPAFEAPPSGVDTVLDDDSQTPTHLRLTSASADQRWQWVWDFYITHATLTINRAPEAIGFSYRGVPAGLLGTEDQLIQSDGTAQGARNSFSGELPGPVEWVYIADTAAARSLFLIQHTDDALPDRYQVRDNDSAMWVFGDGQITSLPIRFSLGLVDGVDAARVGERVQFVADAIH